MTTLTHYEKNRGNFSRAKVMVIEDDDDHWFLLQKAINHCLPEITCVRVNTTTAALKLLTKWTSEEWELPKLILQDLYLPTQQEGWQLVKQIKNLTPVCSCIPLVILSSSSDPVDIKGSYESGVATYTVKPLDFSGWLAYFSQLRSYWWETVTLPPIQFSC